uniref:Putative secreted protein n=1 Tax=Ixodes ricinus TaxID=34613 RepID=A0A6B0U2V6_IXORI
MSVPGRRRRFGALSVLSGLAACGRQTGSAKGLNIFQEAVDHGCCILERLQCSQNCVSRVPGSRVWLLWRFDPIFVTRCIVVC